jgi:O-methyltransferase
MKKLIKSVFAQLGLQITRKPRPEAGIANPFDGYDYSEKGNAAVNLTKNNSMMPHINLYTLYEQAVYCEKNNIEGAYVECGVWKGGAVGIMAKANMDYGKTRRPIHLFDAFDDICAPDAEKDGAKAVSDMIQLAGMKETDEMNGQLVAVKGAYDFIGGHGTIDACKDLLENKIHYPSAQLHYHKGWFQDTVPVDYVQIDKIAILRLDGDWYDSIKICLEYLYDKVEPGGLVVIDDYGYYEGCTKAVDEFLTKKGIKTFLSYSSIGCRYFVKNNN